MLEFLFKVIDTTVNWRCIPVNNKKITFCKSLVCFDDFSQPSYRLTGDNEVYWSSYFLFLPCICLTSSSFDFHTPDSLKMTCTIRGHHSGESTMAGPSSDLWLIVISLSNKALKFDQDYFSLLGEGTFSKNFYIFSDIKGRQVFSSIIIFLFRALWGFNSFLCTRCFMYPCGIDADRLTSYEKNRQK